MAREIPSPTKEATVRLDHVTYVGLVFAVLVVFSIIRRVFEFDLPFPLLPMSVALVVAAFLYGLWAGRTGKHCDPSFKSWVVARKMVLTGLCIVLALFLFQVFALGLWTLMADETALMRYAVQIGVVGFISFVLCRFAFMLGVKRGFAMFLKKKNRSV
ncbi:hypothetical protein [Ruegeria arenilitoris]|uniref:hypothetical protein n=1 Tax=Ruegeria arenilitoris TaxID=1173585 RepID=UPI00147C16C2|nr:hypothetical protein [Ruegeria arenilitoris]